MHVHATHSDYLLIISGRMILGLYDLRPEVAEDRISGAVALEAANPTAVTIPPGVCHGLLPHDLSIAYEVLGYLPPAHSAIATVPGHAYSSLLAVLQGPGPPQVTMETSVNHPGSKSSLIVVGSRESAQLADSYDDRIFIGGGMRGLDAGPL